MTINVIKNQFLLVWVKKQDTIIFCQSEIYYKHKDSTRLKVKEEENMYKHSTLECENGYINARISRFQEKE